MQIFNTKHKNITLLPLLFVLNSFNYSILSSNTTPRSEDKIFNFFPIILSFSFSHTGWFAKTTRKSITFSRWSLWESHHVFLLQPGPKMKKNNSKLVVYKPGTVINVVLIIFLMQLFFSFLFLFLSSNKSLIMPINFVFSLKIVKMMKK